MKVTSISPAGGEYVEIDETDGAHTTYRRYSAGNWEFLIGNSWEMLSICDKHEAAYQAALRIRES
jgi:hypothetical protein